MFGKFVTRVILAPCWAFHVRDRQSAADKLRYGRPPPSKVHKKFDEIVARNQKRTKVA
jgi:hypothetical protein